MEPNPSDPKPTQQHRDEAHALLDALGLQAHSDDRVAEVVDALSRRDAASKAAETAARAKGRAEGLRDARAALESAHRRFLMLGAVLSAGRDGRQRLDLAAVAETADRGWREVEGVLAHAGPASVRPEVAAFAQLMEQKLRENDHKGGWQYTPTNYLAARLGEEGAELNALLIEARTDIAAPPSSALNRAERIRVGREAADIANFAMMIADVCGALSVSGWQGGMEPESSPDSPTLPHVGTGSEYERGLRRAAEIAEASAAKWEASGADWSGRRQAEAEAIADAIRAELPTDAPTKGKL